LVNISFVLSIDVCMYVMQFGGPHMFKRDIHYCLLN